MKEILAGRLGGLQQGSLKCCGDQRLQVAPADFGVCILRADDFALLGQAYLSADRAGWLRQDGLVAWAAATADRATSPVKHAQLDVVCIGQLVEQLDQCNFCAVEFPVAGKDAAVLVAVRIAQHDVLLGATALYELGNAGQGIELAHDGCGISQVFNGLEQGDHYEVVGGMVVQRAVHQADFLLQQQHFQQVAHGFGVADDVVTYRLLAKACTGHKGGFKNGQLTGCMCGIAGADHAQWPGVIEKPDQQCPFGGLL